MQRITKHNSINALGKSRSLKPKYVHIIVEIPDKPQPKLNKLKLVFVRRNVPNMVIAKATHLIATLHNFISN